MCFLLGGISLCAPWRSLRLFLFSGFSVFSVYSVVNLAAEPRNTRKTRNKEETESALHTASLDLVETFVPDSIFSPVLVIEMPPFRVVNGEAFGLHRIPQQLAMPALQRCSARITGVRTIGCFVVRADH